MLHGILTPLAMAVLLLTSCAPASTPAAEAEALPTVTSTSPMAATQASTPTVIPASPTATQVPCDPFTADFCITDGHFILQSPILPPGDTSIDITYRYGSTQNGRRDPHHGVEIGKGFGTPVHAAGEGTVIFAGPDREASYNPYNPYYDFYGNLVVIEHDGDLYTMYAHLSSMDVEAGDFVAAGDQIGAIGQSGAATGPHLHFEVRLGEVEDYFSTVNPELWLFPSQAEFGAIAFSIVNGGGGFRQTSITIQRMDESEAYYIDTYHASLAIGSENAAIGNLPAGSYRITLIFNGHFYERWVEVESGKLTQVVIVVE